MAAEQKGLLQTLLRLPSTAAGYARKAAKRFRKQRVLRRAQRGRRRSQATFIAITGSSGKSTTTALIAHILSGVAPAHGQVQKNTYKAYLKSFQGRLPPTGFFVGEIGADDPGSLQPMLDLIRPTVGVVTLVALEHKSALRTIDGVAEEKGRLVEALPANGLAILNHDDPRVAAMAERTKARTVTFGLSGGNYVVSNVLCLAPEKLSLTIASNDQAFEVTSQLTGAHQSLSVAAAFACTHQLGVPPAVIVERIASFPALFARCSVHRVPNGPVLIVDTIKAPHHSTGLVLDMLAEFRAPRKRIVIGHISDASGSDRTYRDVYRAARSVVDQVIFIGEHSHRSKATTEDIADGRFVRFERLEDLASFLSESAIQDEIILLKSAPNTHLEKVMLSLSPQCAAGNPSEDERTFASQYSSLDMRDAGMTPATASTPCGKRPR